MISEKRLEEFKRLYKKHFNKDISDQEALESATKLLRLVEIVYQPITKKEYEKYKKTREEREKDKKR